MNTNVSPCCLVTFISFLLSAEVLICRPSVPQDEDESRDKQKLVLTDKAEWQYSDREGHHLLRPVPERGGKMPPPPLFFAENFRGKFLKGGKLSVTR